MEIQWKETMDIDDGAVEGWECTFHVSDQDAEQDVTVRVKSDTALRLHEQINSELRNYQIPNPEEDDTGKIAIALASLKYEAKNHFQSIPALPPLTAMEGRFEPVSEKEVEQVESQPVSV